MKYRYFDGGEIKSSELGPGAVRFRSGDDEIEVAEVAGGFELRTLDGALVIVSEAANQVYVQVKQFDGKRGVT